MILLAHYRSQVLAHYWGHDLKIRQIQLAPEYGAQNVSKLIIIIMNYTSTVTIWLPDNSSIWVVQMWLVVEWSSFQVVVWKQDKKSVTRNKKSAIQMVLITPFEQWNKTLSGKSNVRILSAWFSDGYCMCLFKTVGASLPVYDCRDFVLSPTEYAATVAWSSLPGTTDNFSPTFRRRNFWSSLKK